MLHFLWYIFPDINSAAESFVFLCIFLLWGTFMSLSPLSPRPGLHQSQRRLVTAMFFVETPTWLSQYLSNQPLRYNTRAKQWRTLDFNKKFTVYFPFLLYYQDSDYAKPRRLSLATLFGFKKDHQSSKPDPVSPLATPLEASSPGLVRPSVARTLTYEDALNSNRSVISRGNVIAVGSPCKGQAAVTGAQTLKEVGGNVVVGLSTSSVTQHQKDQDKPQQHCPAFQKLMQAQRGVSGGVGTLQTVSESPENRLCDNGVPVENPHQPQFLPHHHHLHHHHHQKTQQLIHDPIKRLFQTQPVFPSSSCLSIAAPLHCSLRQNIASQPIVVTSVPCSHFRAQQSHQSCFEPPKAQTESLHNQSASSLQGKGGSSV